MRTWKPLLAVLLALLLGTAGVAAAKTNPNRGKSLFRANCKSCHVKGAEGKLLSPLTKTQAQWRRAFKGGPAAVCVKKLAAKTGKQLTAEDLADLEAYLVAHAADSDQPETCGQ